MASVINLLHYKNRVEQPVLILAGLHQSDQPGIESDTLDKVLGNCKVILTSARSAGMPIAFVRCIAPPSSVSEPRTYPPWLKGFEPTRNDMIFDVTQASCYSNSEFAQTMEYTNGNFAIAGLFGETTCLSTAIDAHHRRHSITYLSDASACRNSGNIPSAVFHDAVAQIIASYGKVMKVTDWRPLLSSNEVVG